MGAFRVFTRMIESSTCRNTAAAARPTAAHPRCRTSACCWRPSARRPAPRPERPPGRRCLHAGEQRRPRDLRRIGEREEERRRLLERRPDVLVLIEQVVHAPEGVLLRRAERPPRPRQRVVVDAGEREVDEHPAHLARSRCSSSRSAGKVSSANVPAVGALEVRHLVHRHRRRRRAADPAGERVLRLSGLAWAARTVERPGDANASASGLDEPARSLATTTPATARSVAPMPTLPASPPPSIAAAAAPCGWTGAACPRSTGHVPVPLGVGIARVPAPGVDPPAARREGQVGPARGPVVSVTASRPAPAGPAPWTMLSYPW